MVKKAALTVLGVIVLVSMGVGVLVGMQLDGSSGAQGPDGMATATSTAEPSDDPTPVPTAGPSTPKADDPVTTEPPADRTTIAPRRFDEDDISNEVKRYINEERTSRGLDPLQTTGNTVDTLEDMATSHSVAMADAGKVNHDIDGNSSKSRYEAYGVYESCQFASEGGGYTIDSSGNRLETVGKTVAGKQYPEGGNLAFNDNETAVASSIVDDWFRSPILQERLTYENANHVGVGVEVTRGGDVYVTANVC